MAKYQIIIGGYSPRIERTTFDLQFAPGIVDAYPNATSAEVWQIVGDRKFVVAGYQPHAITGRLQWYGHSAEHRAAIGDRI